MNFKRKGPKATRAGCLLCKPNKHQRVKGGVRRAEKRRWRRVEGLD